MGKDSISIGNVVGSNIFNLGLILGGTALIERLKHQSYLQRWFFSAFCYYFVIFFVIWINNITKS